MNTRVSVGSPELIPAHKHIGQSLKLPLANEIAIGLQWWTILK